MTAAILSSQTAASESERAMLERAVVNQLASLRRETGGYLEFVGEYNGELGGADDENELAERLLGRCPAVLVATGEESFTQESVRHSVLRGSLELELIVVSAHLRSSEARTLGDEQAHLTPTADPGVYRILADCRRLLHGRDLAVDGMNAPIIRGASPAVRSKAITAFTQTYGVSYRYTQPAIVSRPVIDSIEHRHQVESVEPDVPVMSALVEAS